MKPMLLWAGGARDALHPRLLQFLLDGQHARGRAVCSPELGRMQSSGEPGPWAVPCLGTAQDLGTWVGPSVSIRSFICDKEQFMSTLGAYFIGVVHCFPTFPVTLAASVAWHPSREHAPSYAPVWAEDQIQTPNE